MVKGRSAGSKLQPSKDSVKKAQKTSKSSAADAGKAPHLPNSKTSTKNNPTGGTTDAIAAIVQGDQISYNDTSIPNVPALTQTPFEDGNIIEHYSHRAATDPIVETSITQLGTTRNYNATNLQSNTAYHEGVQTSAPTEPHHTGEDDQDWMDSDEVETNEYQLGLWAYGTSSDSTTVAERLEKSSWTCAREERL